MVYLDKFDNKYIVLFLGTDNRVEIVPKREPYWEFMKSLTQVLLGTRFLILDLRLLSLIEKEN